MDNQLGSFVFFDVETTGLPQGSKMPKITEMSLIACSRQHLLETKYGELPRVLHKQTFCLNPSKMIEPRAAEITGLYNNLLENEAKFDEKLAQLILLFLERLQGPTCLVAHNGNRFDFCILKQELDSLETQLPEDTYCVDSLPLFQALDKAKEEKGETLAASTSKTNSFSNRQYQPVRKSFALGKVYERQFGYPPKDSHDAESDVKTLLECAIAEASDFVAYAEKNWVKFQDFIPDPSRY